MNEKQIRKQLKNELDAHSPDLYDKIMLSAQAEGLLPADRTDETIGQGDTAALAKNNRRTGIMIASCFAAILLLLAIVLPILLKGFGGTPVSPAAPSLSANDVYGIGAVSTAKLLGENVSSGAVRAFSAVRKAVPQAEDGTDTTTNAIKTEVEKFNEYFTALDSFLGDEVVTTVSEANTDEAYPFETKLTIAGKDIFGNDEKYIMYFTETFVKIKTESDEDDESESETESEYKLEGILVIDGTDYFLEGERSFEQDKKETENELKIRAYADKTDRANYIEMKQENSEEEHETETEYVYRIYSQGNLIEETAVEFETERKGDKEKTEYELEFRKGDAKGKYKVTRKVKNGTTQIEAEYELNGQKGKFEISRQSDKKYKYDFPDGSSLIL